MQFDGYVSATIDWISATFVYEALMDITARIQTDNVVKAFAHILDIQDGWQLVPGRHSYRYGAANPRGIMLYWGGTARMGVHVQFQGRYLSGIKCVTDVVDLVLGLRGRFTRIDLALDVTEPSCADDVYRAYETGRLVTRAKGVMRIQSASGSTVYVGSRYSDRYLRVYDKGRQINSGVVWTRVELEIKGRKADLCARVIHNQGLRVVPSLVRSYVDIPTLPWYSRAVRQHNVKFGIPDVPRERDTRRWLLEIALPCLIREMKNDQVFKSQAVELLRTVLREEDMEIDFDRSLKYARVSED